MDVQNWIAVFQQSIQDYHIHDSVDKAMDNPHGQETIEHTLYLKNWVDTVQWHLEDIIRDPKIDPVQALAIKRRIDSSNQLRTDLVEAIDNWLLASFGTVHPLPAATINTETPAWAIDRLSILELKIYHMQIEAERTAASEEHRIACQNKLGVLLIQRKDLAGAIAQLLGDIRSGRKIMRLYKQMKMYNDESLNPVLYQQKEK